MASKKPSPSPSPVNLHADGSTDRPPAAPAAKPRVVLTQSITHISPTGGEPVNLTVGYARFLRSDEPPYQRPSTRAGGEWRLLDLGWLKEPVDAGEGGPPNVSEIVLFNLEGSHLQKIPTPEEREDTARRVLEVGMATLGGGDMWDTEEDGLTPPAEPDYMVHPGEVFRARPVNPRRLMVRARSKDHPVKYSLLVIPG